MTKAGVIVAGIIILSLALAITSFWNDSLIVDEIPHVGSGYGYVKNLDYRLNPEHPPLTKALAAAPLLFLDLKQEAFRTKFWLQDINGQWDFGRFFIFQSGNDADLITKAVKFPILAFFIIAAIQVYCWAQRMYGKFAAFVALTLFTFSPTIIAHSRFVTTDVPALFGILLATSLFLKYLYRPARKNLWFAGIGFGIAILTKFSTFLLVPYFLILALIFGLTKNPKILHTKYFILNTILIFIIGFVLVVWPVYYLFTFNYPPERQLADTKFLLGSFGNRTLVEIVEWTANKPLFRALGQYGLGLLMVGQRAVGGNTTYFLGEVSASGWRYYFPVVYALKEPLSWLIFLAASLLYLAWQMKLDKFKNSGFRQRFTASHGNLRREIPDWIKNHFIEFAMLLWLAIYWATSIKSNLNIGVRHLLPTYPFVIILVSGQLARIYQKLKIKNQNYNSDSATNRKRFGGTFDEQSKIKILNFNMPFLFFIFAFLFLMGWYVYENIRIWPHYLTYFNQLAGGPSGGYRYVVDSNLDWGQDLKRLSLWTEEKNIEAIHLDYFGWSDPAYYLGSKFIWLTTGQYKNAQDFIDKTGGGYIAVSATFFMGSRGDPEKNYAWLERYEPVTVIGNSIWVWKLE